MNRHPMDMLHDELVHEGMRRTAFLIGLVAAILVLHRLIYHVL